MSAAAKALLAFALLATLAGGVYFGWVRCDKGRRDYAATAKPAKENVGAVKPVKEDISDTKPVDEDAKVSKPVKEESGNAKDVAEPTKPEQKPEIPEQDRTSSGKTEIETPDELEQLLSADKTYKFFEAYNNDRYDEAARLINSINLEDVTVQFCLGWMYAYGYGVTKNESEAVKWYRKAAEQNDAAAQFFLGNMYLHGRGIETSETEAAKLFRKAAEQNHAAAQFLLGMSYENGWGVEKDVVEATKWYQKAAEQGVEDAKKALKRLNTETTTYIVQPGDTLSKISKMTGIKIDAIKKANPQIKNGIWRVGQKLTLPGKVEIEPPKAVMPPALPQPYTGPTKTYVVKAGDSLGSIARAHKISIRQLKAMNSMKKDVISVGLKLTVPDPAAVAK